MPNATEGASGFLRLFNSIADQLTGHEQLVAFQLLRHWSENGEIFPGVTRIAERTGLHRTTVMKAIRSLEHIGALRVVRTKGLPNKYTLTGLVRVVAHSDQSSTATSCPDRPNQSLPATQVVAHSDPKKPTKRSNKKPTYGAPWKSVPEDWNPAAEHQTLATQLRVNLRSELSMFRDHEFKSPKRDPDAAFRTWLRKAAQFQKSGNRPPPPQRGLAAHVKTGTLDGLGDE